MVNEWIQSAGLTQDLVRTIPRELEGPWSCIGCSANVWNERLPVDRWQVGMLRTSIGEGQWSEKESQSGASYMGKPSCRHELRRRSF